MRLRRPEADGWRSSWPVSQLLARYRNAPPVARALMDAAIDARRLGMGETIPLAFLEATAPGYLDDSEWEEAAAAGNWLERALAYTQEPV